MQSVHVRRFEALSPLFPSTRICDGPKYLKMSRFCDGLFLLSICSLSSSLPSTDFAKYIPEDDLKAIKAGSLRSNVPPSDTSVYVYQEDIIGCLPSQKPVCPLQTTEPQYFRLPDGTVEIPYIVEPEVDETLIDEIVLALESISNQTGCMQFASADDAAIKHVPSRPVIRFSGSDMCAGEFEGAKSPRHKVYISPQCINGERSNIQRLILLAMGFPHEVSRNDRDQYIIINWYNVVPERTWELEKYDRGVFDSLPYDYDSILHPGYVFLAQNTKMPTIMAKNKARVGQNKQLSETDIKKIQNLICKKTATQPAATQNAQIVPDTPVPTPTPTKKPSDNEIKVPAVPIKSAGAAPSKADATTGDIQPSMCSLRQLVLLQNTQTMSRTTVFPTKRRLNHSTKDTTWWYAQDSAPDKTDYLGQSVDYTEFSGVVKTVTTKLDNAATRILETEYQPLVLDDGNTRLQRKFETRIVQCQDRERSL
ncbi:hatching enzyme 1.2-like [Paramacrobiotus metropolitanus]|uniref:hatching enzyme 1.2-like n=1 Tax=Paramacrobiotus metropolitanus TaxID=2943436 RepID=UPI002445B302|nr:hatching enzyme 1.2-like [Paramacrobiotus metropolitanus]